MTFDLNIPFQWHRAVQVGTIAAAIWGLTAGVFGGMAHAHIPDANGLYTACYTPGTAGGVRLIDYEAGQRCRPNERTVTWNEAGQTGPAGQQGSQGPQGEPGAPATKLFAFVERDGVLVANRSSGAISASTSSDGFFTVEFNQDVSKCVLLATTEPIGSGVGIFRGYANVFHDDSQPTRVFVLTTNSGGQTLGFDFNLAVFCK